MYHPDSVFGQLHRISAIPVTMGSDRLESVLNPFLLLRKQHDEVSLTGADCLFKIKEV